MRISGGSLDAGDNEGESETGGRGYGCRRDDHWAGVMVNVSGAAK